MMHFRVACLLLASAFVLTAFGHNDTTSPTGFCGHHHVWSQYREPLLPLDPVIANEKRALACRMQSECDDPSYVNTVSLNEKTLAVKFHIANVPGGIPTSAELDGQIALFKSVWKTLDVVIDVVDVVYHNTYVANGRTVSVKCTPAYSSSGAWYTQAQQFKASWSDGTSGTSRHIDIIISCMDAGSAGQLNGYGVFPWDPNANSVYGGVFLNTKAVPAPSMTLAHELGHNTGLWHTFHGIDEVSGCNDACYEPVHVSGGSYDTVGDFCTDTASTPKQWGCTTSPVSTTGSRTDCTGRAYSAAYPSSSVNSISQNIMSYASCRSEFSPDQIKRAHCYMCNPSSFLRPMVQGC